MKMKELFIDLIVKRYKLRLRNLTLAPYIECPCSNSFNLLIYHLINSEEKIMIIRAENRNENKKRKRKQV